MKFTQSTAAPLFKHIIVMVSKKHVRKEKKRGVRDIERRGGGTEGQREEYREKGIQKDKMSTRQIG